METYSKKEIKRLAYRYIFDHTYILFGKYPRLDMRYNKNKAIMAEINKIIPHIDRYKIQKIRKQRRILHAVPDFINIFDRPLIKDYLNNKRSIDRIDCDRIRFGLRNHWAKNEKDFKILKILQKNYINHLVV